MAKTYNIMTQDGEIQATAWASEATLMRIGNIQSTNLLSKNYLKMPKRVPI